MSNVDYPGALPMFVPVNDEFFQFTPKAIVIHKTGDSGVTDGRQIAQFFINSSPGPSAHYIVDLDGTIIQCVPEDVGAGGNCCLDPGHDPFWDQYAKLSFDDITTPNLNTLTFSIEHIDPSGDNSMTPPEAQLKASFDLVVHLCKTHNIPSDHIKPHSGMMPIKKPTCPGNYPMNELIAYVEEALNPKVVEGPELTPDPVPEPDVSVKPGTPVLVQNTHMQRQAHDVWHADDAFYDALQPPAVPDNTGIAQVFFEKYEQFNLGTPAGKEFATVDGGGIAIAMQFFKNGGRIEYYVANGNGHSIGENHGYDVHNVRLW